MNQTINIVGIGGTLREESRSLYALDYAMKIARSHGAQVKRYSVRDLQLPMYDPSQKFNDLTPQIQEFVNAMRSAHGMIWSTGAYHGTLAGVTKNAIDYMEFLSGGENPYLDNKVIGLIATAGGDMAGVNTLAAMVHSVHSLRGSVAPLMVSIHNAKNMFDEKGHLTSSKYEKKLSGMARLVVDLAQKHNASQYVATS